MAGEDKKKPVDNKNNKKEKKDAEEEDAEEIEEYRLLIERVQDTDAEIQKNALNMLRENIQQSTASMTSVPKPLKIVSPFWPVLREYYDNRMPPNDNKQSFASLLSVIAMTSEEEKKHYILKYRLHCMGEDFTVWGHEYLRSLCREIVDQYEDDKGQAKDTSYLMPLVQAIAKYDMTHSAEAEACDLLMEVEALDLILDLITPTTYSRIVLYLLSSAAFSPDPENEAALKFALRICKTMKQYSEAARIAMMMNDPAEMLEILGAAPDRATKVQLAYMFSTHYPFLSVDDEELDKILHNNELSSRFQKLQKDLEFSDPKVPEDAYKSHLSDAAALADKGQPTPRTALANAFVNGFLNVGSGKDKMTTVDERAAWLYSSNGPALISAAASVAWLNAWDIDGGAAALDKYTYASSQYTKAGAYLGMGICNSGASTEFDTALQLLSGIINDPITECRIGAILGLGLAYAGSNKAELIAMLVPLVADGDCFNDIAVVACLALGYICVGSGNPDATEAIMLAIMERAETLLTKDVPTPAVPATPGTPTPNAPTAAATTNENAAPEEEDDQSHKTGLTSHLALFFPLGLALIHLCKQSEIDTVLEAASAIPGVLGSATTVLLNGLAYAGTGNVLVVQKMLRMCNEHLDKNHIHQGLAIIMMALIAMGDDVGKKMCLRSLDLIMEYCEPNMRVAIPLALALLYPSDPDMNAGNTLTRLINDSDYSVAECATLALGIVACGTNNARIAGSLRSLSAYKYKGDFHYIIRIALGMLYMGKGLITVNPYHLHNMALRHVSMCGILTVLVSALNMHETIMGKHSYLLHTIITAVRPRAVVTLDAEKFETLPADVRVGQAVDVIGQPGKPKTITGFQTQTTPAIIGPGERAELASDKYLPLSCAMEDVVLLKKNLESEEWDKIK